MSPASERLSTSARRRSMSMEIFESSDRSSSTFLAGDTSLSPFLPATRVSDTGLEAGLSGEPAAEDRLPVAPVLPPVAPDAPAPLAPGARTGIGGLMTFSRVTA